MNDKVKDFNLFKEEKTTVIQIVDKYWEFTAQDFEILKSFMFDFVSECMKKHTKQGYLHSNDIDEILKMYK